jgi:hypothetical protein
MQKVGLAVQSTLNLCAIRQTMIFTQQDSIGGHTCMMREEFKVESRSPLHTQDSEAV